MRKLVTISILFTILLMGCSQEKRLDKYCEEPKYTEFYSLPKDLLVYYDFEQGLNCSRKTEKPIFLTFTGHGCMCCREAYFINWLRNDSIYQILKDNYVVIALYVDDKISLDSNEFYISDYSGKQVETIGKKNSDFQITRFETNTQPYSVVLEGDGNTIIEPLLYTSNNNEKIEYMKKGLVEYQKMCGNKKYSVFDR